MSPFAEAARALSGVAARTFGWRPDEFWRATPDELAALFETLAPAVAAPVDIERLKELYPDG